MMRSPFLWSAALGATLLLAACSRATAPAAPPAEVPGVSTLSSHAVAPTFGIYRLAGDLESQSFEFTPLDHGAMALGDSFAVDITKLSETTLRFTGVELPTPDTLRLSMSWEHPLPGTTNRRDLSVFDLRAHILTGLAGTSFAGASGLSAPTGAAGASEPVVMADIDVQDADGWSSWGDEVVEPVTGAMPPTIYPYVLVHEDTGRGTVDPLAPAGWNVVPQATGVYDFSFDIGIANNPSLDLLIGLDASYGASAMKSIPNPGVGSRLNPRYLNPEFNVKEGWRATATISGPVEAGNPGSSAQLTLTVFDHQGPLAASGAFDPLTAPANSLRYASGLDQADISVPGALLNSMTILGSFFSGDGTPADPYVHNEDITGDLIDSLATPGDYVGLVAFVDEMRASAAATSPLPTKGYDRASAVQNRFDFATYATFTLTVEPTVPLPPTWTNVHDIIMNGDSSTGASACMMCHAGGSGGLFMDSNSAATYANLVNVPSSCGDDYIEPNDPANSFLYHKVSTPLPDCGLRMPQNGPPYLGAAKIALIQSWINDGAPFN